MAYLQPRLHPHGCPFACPCPSRPRLGQGLGQADDGAILQVDPVKAVQHLRQLAFTIDHYRHGLGEQRLQKTRRGCTEALLDGLLAYRHA